MDTEKAPRVSIILPTYNRRETLTRAIGSIRAQSLTAWELIVINDASSDGTRAYLDGLAAEDSRICPVHHESNRYPDISGTLNEGLSLARAGYIARLDDDDYWCDKRKLDIQAAFLDAHADCVIVGGGVIAVDEKDNERLRYYNAEHDSDIRRKALFVNPFAHSTVMFRKDIALAAGGYGNGKNTEDWDLWLRMGMRGSFYNFQEYFVRYRMTQENKTFVFKRSQSKEILRNIAAHRKEYPGAAKAYSIGLMQYVYALLPLAARRIIYRFSFSAKRMLSRLLS